MLIGDYIVLPMVESQSSITYPTFGQANYHLGTDVINMCEHFLKFFGKPTDNLKYSYI